MKNEHRANPSEAKEISFLKQRIKELEQSESDLKKNEQRFRSLSEASLEAIVFIENGIIVDANKALNRLFGYEGEDLRGRPATDFIVPEGRFLTNERMRTHTEGVYETLGFRKDGSTFPIEVNPHEFEYEGKKLRISAVRDLTEWKKVEKALLESEQRYRAVFENTGTATVIIESDTMISLCNTEFERLSGYTRNDIEGKKSWTDFVVRDDLDRMVAQHRIRRENHDQALQRYEFRFASRTGEILNIYLVIDTIHGTERSVASLTDITDRKRMEENLRLSETKYRTIVENANDAIYIYDFEGNIIDVNENACRMVGYYRDELIGAKLSKIDKAWQIFENPELEQLIERGSTTFERENVHKDGTVMPVEVSMKIVNSEGKGIMLGFVRDITDRKRMEEELLRASKLESLGVLAGGIAHDFNNLMTVVLGNVQLAMMGLPTKHKSYPLLRAVMQSAEQIKDLTSRLITFSKGGFPVKQMSDVSEVLQEVVRKMVKRTAVRVAFDIEKDLCPVALDENQIRQVFYNLTMNAIEAMPEGGMLTIQAHNAKINPSDRLPLKEGPYLRIIFADNGKGIAEENLVRIFDPYFTTKGMGANKGVGLGLSVCYAVLKKHDGYIYVTSRPGEGAVFTLYIPVLAEKTHKVKTKQTKPSSPKQVLIMEDEIHVRALERAFLERLGYKVTEAGDGQEAIDRFKEAVLLNNPFDLVILDLTVRHGLGGQLTMERMLKEDSSVKAIIASGYVDEPVMERYNNYGFRGALKKPFSFEEFEEMVKKVIGTEA